MIQMILTLDDNGQFNVSGPIGNKGMAYGMLEMAKDAVREYVDRAANQRVQLADGPLPPVPPSLNP